MQQAVRRLTRSRKERVFAGICGGLAMYLGIDPVLMRVLFVAATMLSKGIGIAVYLLGWFIIPLEPEGGAHYIPRDDREGKHTAIKVAGVLLIVAGLLNLSTSFFPSFMEVVGGSWVGPIVLVIIGSGLILWRASSGSSSGEQSTNLTTGDSTMQSGTSSQYQAPVRRLVRIKEGRKIAGVCSGIGQYFNVDPTIIRLIWLAMILVAGTGIIFYIICWIAMPLDESAVTPLTSAGPPPNSPSSNTST